MGRVVISTKRAAAQGRELHEITTRHRAIIRDDATQSARVLPEGHADHAAAGGMAVRGGEQRLQALQGGQAAGHERSTGRR